MGKLQKLLIMAGGTGGHVFPGLAVAKELQAQGIEVHWLGTRKGLESRLVPDAGIPIHFISISGLRGKNIKDILLAPFRLALAILQALLIIRRLRPDVVLGMGGFASGPGGIAAWCLRHPLVIHEQNAKPGLTNQWLAYVAAKILEGFPDTFSSRSKLVTTGNPVRTEIAVLPPPSNRFQRKRDHALRLLILGGSLGAAAFNDLVPKTLALLSAEKRPAVRHQTGEKHWEKTQRTYHDLNIQAEVLPFIADMSEAYAWADIVLCRAGALTIAELCAAGLGAILVPYPYAVDDHQTANANYLVKHNAGLLIQQSELTEASLLRIIKQLTDSPETCVTMAQAAYQLRKVDATNQVLKVCGEICY